MFIPFFLFQSFPFFFVIPEVNYSDCSHFSHSLKTALVCKNYGNTTAGNEVKYVAADVAVIDKKPVPDVPTLLIISDGSVTGGWIGFEKISSVVPVSRRWPR